MKFYYLILVIGTLLSCQQKQSGQVQNQTENKGGFGKFEFQEEFYNFGKLKSGEIVSFAFKFKNAGNAPLVISKAETDCGCIQVIFPDEPISAGDYAYLEVTFNTAGEIGKQLKTITLAANTDQPAQLYVTADVENEWINLNN